jgi:transcriptional regulator with XRE-family HTH domain
MALFFDSAWFDARLAAAGLQRSDVATALGLSSEQIGEVWKDQRELSASDVRLLAALLAVPASEIASRAGVSTPVPRAAAPDLTQLAEFDARLTRIEHALAEIRALLLDLRRASP